MCVGFFDGGRIYDNMCLTAAPQELDVALRLPLSKPILLVSRVILEDTADEMDRSRRRTIPKVYQTED